MKLPVPIRKALEKLQEVTENRVAQYVARGKTVRLEELDLLLADPDFWRDSRRARDLTREHDMLKKRSSLLVEQQAEAKELLVLAELAWEEEDSSAQAEVEVRRVKLEQALTWQQFEDRFDDELDKNDCTLEIHAGAGGTESQDWAEMLLRLYTRWAESHAFQTELLSMISGETAGVKSVILRVTGLFAYGWLKGEEGVHRLVRISPFDAENRRHTSFASVAVYPAQPERNINLDTKDLKIDTFRASGAGGQHVNRTDSAVRITHIPTGIVVQCQNNRSQHQNKATAMELLAERIEAAERQKQASEKKSSYAQKDAIGWSYQIRSYVMQPYQLVKDLRTNVETGNVQAVMDGDIDRFLLAYLDAQKDNE